MTSRTVVVIGHVDHGKTSLVRALTGMDTDRLPEEKRRGLSITAGFAYRTYAAGSIDFIDAPGHESFIRAMVAGAAGVDAALLVVSLASGVERQTHEHVQIAEQLGIRHWLVVATKSDLVAKSEHQSRMAAILDAVVPATLTETLPLVCSAKTGEGLPQVHAALEALIEAGQPRNWPAHAFMAVDRVFSVPGAGTVVTGTLLGQHLAMGEAITIQPAGRSAIIRGLQARGADVQRVDPGSRAAINLRGIDVGEVVAGDVICSAGTCSASPQFDVQISVSTHASRGIRHTDDVRTLFGTSSEVASVRIIGAKEINPGESGYAQLRFSKPVAGHTRQRIILRRLSPAETIGGCILLDPAPTPTTRNNQSRHSVLVAAGSENTAALQAALVRQSGGAARFRDLSRLTGQRLSGPDCVVLDPEHFSDTAAIEHCRSALLSALNLWHAAHQTRATAPREQIRRSLNPPVAPLLLAHVENDLVAAGLVRRSHAGLAASGHNPFDHLTEAQKQQLANAETALQEGGLNPPSPAGIFGSSAASDLLEILVSMDRAISLWNVSLRQMIVFHRDAVRFAAETLRSRFPPPTSFTTSEARSVLETSRKHIVPLMEHFDAIGITVRHGDTREVAEGDVSV